MTEKFTCKSKLKTILILLLVCVMSCTLFCLTACDKEESKKTSTETTKNFVEETDTAKLTNGSFEYGVIGTAITSFPVTTVNSWTRSLDNSSLSSKVESGVIDTSSEGFAELFNTLYDSTTYKLFLKDKYSADIDGLGDDATEDQIKELLKEKFVENNPNSADGENGKVLMINNFTATLGVGTAQKYSSGVALTLKKDTYGVVKVKVKTADLSYAYGDSDYGANVRLTNTVAGVKQDEYKISNIVCADWTEYSIFVKSNDFAEATVKVVLGLGYGNGNSAFEQDYVEGTAYFDDVTFEEIDKAEYETATASLTASKLSLTAETAEDYEEVNAFSGDTTFALDLTSTDFFTSAPDLTNALVYDFTETTSNTGLSGARFETAVGEFNSTADALSIKVNRASYTLNMKNYDGNNIPVPANGFVVLTCDIENKLSAFDTSGVSVIVNDINGDEELNTITLSNSIDRENVTRYTIIVKNNFTTAREFNLDVVVGPTDVTKNDPTAYPVGEVILTNLTIAGGSLDEDDYTPSNIATFNQFNLLAQTVNSTTTFEVPLYAGNSGDYVENEEDEVYSFNVAYSDIGKIESAPAKVKNYKGVEAYDDVAFNLNADAGLINTKYLSAYADATDITNALGSYTDDIQPLMINNKTAKTYGFLSTTFTISKNTNVLVSVKVKVSEDAKAYIYLVDTAIGENQLNVLSHKFTADDGTEHDNTLSAVVENTNGEWVTVSFYVGAGDTPLNYRVELWNGSRNGDVTSQGIVFFDEVSTTTTFVEETVLETAHQQHWIDYADEVTYTRALDENEIKFNKDVKDSSEKISYSAKTIWASNFNADTNTYFTYAIYNTIDPTPVDPYAETDGGETETGSTDKKGCQKANSADFWLSLSSIVIAVALVLALIALVIKIFKNKKARKGEKAKSHYKVTSRNKLLKDSKQKKAVSKDFDDNADSDDDVTPADFKKKEEKAEEATLVEEPVIEEDETTETTEEEYQYQDVTEDFSDKFYTGKEEKSDDTDGSEDTDGSDDEDKK